MAGVGQTAGRVSGTQRTVGAHIELGHVERMRLAGGGPACAGSPPGAATSTTPRPKFDESPFVVAFSPAAPTDETPITPGSSAGSLTHSFEYRARGTPKAMAWVAAAAAR